MNPELFFAAPLVVQLHSLAAMAALGVGLWIVLAPKGTFSHRTLGWVFAVLMVTVAVSAVFIRNINDGQFSWIHLFVPLSMLSLFSGVRAIRFLKDVKRHRGAMLGLVFGALAIPGAFAFAPGRLMWRVLVGG